MAQPKIGSVPFTKMLTANVNPAEVAANTSAVQTFTIKGLRPNMFPIVTAPSLAAGLVISHAWVSANDTLSVVFGNLTGTPINDAAQDIFIYIP